MALHGLLGALYVLLSLQLARCKDPGFDLFVFVRSYSPSFCKENSCTIRPISAFTIHGLWPEYNNGLWPEFCGDKDAINASSGGFDDIRWPGHRRLHTLPDAAAAAQSAVTDAAAEGPALERKKKRKKKGKKKKRDGGDEPGPAPGPTPGPAPGPEPDDDPSEQQQCEWPSFKGPNAGFWQHEWDRHGTCARPVTGERQQFFQAVLQLHETYGLDAVLAAAGIQPSDSKAYPARRLSRAVEDAFGVVPLLSCYEGQLLELWLCVGLDLKVEQCPPKVRKSFRPTCGATIKLPLGAPVPAQCKPYFPPWSAPSGGSKHPFLVRLATGAAVASAGAAAAALLWSGLRGRQRSILDSVPQERYDPLQSWP